MIAEILAELNRAKSKFPTYEPGKSTVEDVRTEAIQTAAMALRFLQSLPKYRFRSGPQHEQKPACAACDRDDYQIGHSDECLEQELPASRRPELMHVCGRCLAEVEIPPVGTPTCEKCGNTGRGSWRTVIRCLDCKGVCQKDDPVRPCRNCGELIGHGACQHQCNVCLGDCCTACSHEHDAGAVICDDCHAHYSKR